MAVVFRGDSRVIYDAEHLVQWLKQGRLQNPMTNETVPTGRRFEDILTPIQLPHMNSTHEDTTARFLRSKGKVGLASYEKHRELIGTLAYILVMVSCIYSIIFMAECGLDRLETKPIQPMEEDSCIWVPPLLVPFQLAGSSVAYWAFPVVRPHAIPTIKWIIGGLLLMPSIVNLINTHVISPEDTRRCITWLLGVHNKYHHYMPIPSRISRLVQRLLLLALTHSKQPFGV